MQVPEAPTLQRVRKDSVIWQLCLNNFRRVVFYQVSRILLQLINLHRVSFSLSKLLFSNSKNKNN
jgi:hypothetical protein